MSPITTHVLDTAAGVPAAGIAVTLLRVTASGPQELATGTTNTDGRVEDLLPAGALQPGVYQLRFATTDYFRQSATATFYPSVAIDFVVELADQHYHVPLLLSPFGYSTYRGS